VSHRNRGFRGWFYFRQGWSMYFAFIFAAVNTLTVTYYLAIENYPFLKVIFPTFVDYIIITVAIGVPLLVGIGYAHFKRTKAYRSEAAIVAEANPFGRRNIVNTEMILKLNFEIINMLIKSSNNQKLSSEETEKIKEVQLELKKFVDARTFENNDDLQFLNKMTKS
tara:strand:+ start:261 stop:758 length:498 start_codon:yes stop_codon:yes gene_type:complete